METMKQVALEFLLEKKTATFKQTWDHVNKKLKANWNEKYSEKPEAIEKIKIGELYTMLTSHGDFVKNEKEQWSLSKFYSFEEVQKMKINVGELED